MALQRLFIASPVPLELLEVLTTFRKQYRSLESLWPWHIRWVEPGQWHITWLFLGDVEAGQTGAIAEALGTALDDLHSISVNLTRLTCWPNINRARTIVCEVERTIELLSISERIGMALPDYPGDKPFRPHITLARLKAKKPAPLTLEEPCRISGLLREISLYRSTLTPDGPIYDKLYIQRL